MKREEYILCLTERLKEMFEANKKYEMQVKALRIKYNDETIKEASYEKRCVYWDIFFTNKPYKKSAIRRIRIELNSNLIELERSGC